MHSRLHGNDVLFWRLAYDALCLGFTRVSRGRKAFMPFVKVAAASALEPGQVMEAEVNGSTYAICNVAGNLTAFDGICPHAGGPLGQGTIEDGRLICPWHAWEYDCRTGANDYDETLKLASFPVKIEGGEILIDLP